MKIPKLVLIAVISALSLNNAFANHDGDGKTHEKKTVKTTVKKSTKSDNKKSDDSDDNESDNNN